MWGMCEEGAGVMGELIRGAFRWAIGAESEKTRDRIGNALCLLVMGAAVEAGGDVQSRIIQAITTALWVLIALAVGDIVRRVRDIRAGRRAHA